MNSWFRIGFLALILIQLLLRVLKSRKQSNAPPTIASPRQGGKNDFRDVPPPPENPQLG